MSERRRPFRRGRRSRPSGHQSHSPSSESYGDADPYLEPMDPSTPTPDAAQIPDARDNMTSPALPSPAPATGGAPSPESSAPQSSESNSPSATPNGSGNGGGGNQQQQQQQQRYDNSQPLGGGPQQRDGNQNPNRHPGERDNNRHNGRRGRN